MRILCTAKDSHIFSTKNNSVFVTLADICLTNLCLNDIVKLICFEQLGPDVLTFLEGNIMIHAITNFI